MASDQASAKISDNDVKRRLSREERRSLILKKASQIFGERGFHNVSMDDVAEHADISKALLYQHFESKETLYLAVMRMYENTLRKALLTGFDAAESPEIRLWRGVQAFFEFVSNNREAWGVVFRDSVSIDGEMMHATRQIHDQMAERVGGLLEQAMLAAGRDPGLVVNVAPIAAYSMVGTCVALADYWTIHPEISVAVISLTAMNMLWLGSGQLLEGAVWLPRESEFTDMPMFSGRPNLASDTADENPRPARRTAKPSSAKAVPAKTRAKARPSKTATLKKTAKKAPAKAQAKPPAKSKSTRTTKPKG